MLVRKKKAKARLVSRGSARIYTHFFGTLTAKKKNKLSFLGEMVMCALSIHKLLKENAERMDQRFFFERAFCSNCPDGLCQHIPGQDNGAVGKIVLGPDTPRRG